FCRVHLLSSMLFSLVSLLYHDFFFFFFFFQAEDGIRDDLVTGVQTCALPISSIPAYPPLARQARIEGQVQIDAVLDENGSVVEMKVVSGPALLYQAALEALKKWKYEPTYLNDQPIAVQLIVTVTFVLSQYEEPFKER